MAIIEISYKKSYLYSIVETDFPSEMLQFIIGLETLFFEQIDYELNSLKSGHIFYLQSVW